MRDTIRENFKWILLIALVVALFFWKILFTNQFSILLGWEGANQQYAWYNFATRAIQQGYLPVWDPYTFSGHTFVGEMQTGLFYPLKLLLYLFPLGDSGILSPRIFHEFYVLAHFLGACFMFFLAKEIGLKRFAAFVSALCFSLGGFVGKVGWANMLDSAIWLPLVVLCLLRAWQSGPGSRGVFYAAWSGILLGMSILAGSLHVAVMHVVIVTLTAVFFAWQARGLANPSQSPLRRIGWPALLVGVVGIFAFATGALQLLPSIEYSALAVRWTGDWGDLFRRRIPYAVVGEGSALPPRSLFAILFGAANVADAEFSPYFGVMPLLLTIIGTWRN